MGLFSRKTETRQQFIVPSELTGATGNFADVRVTPDQALRLSAVWACIRLLADMISSLPVDAHRRGGEEFTSPLLQAPAAGWTLPEWVYATMVSLLLRGNAFGFITARSGPRLSPTQVELVNPDLMTTQVNSDGSVVRRYRGAEVDPGDLWHVRAFTYPGSPDGLSPIQFAAESIGLGLATQRFGQQFFSEGAMPSGLLNVPQVASTDQVERIKAVLSNATRGKRDPLIISGDVTWTPLAVKPEESQFVDGMKFNVAQVARIFGVPPEMIGAESGDQQTYANIEARSLHFLQYSLTPWLVRLENAISSLLPRGSFVKFNTGGLLRATTKERYESYAIALAAGFRTIPEIRELEDLPPLEPMQLQLATEESA
jgi:HK97 family phage portal protein